MSQSSSSHEPQPTPDGNYQQVPHQQPLEPYGTSSQQPVSTPPDARLHASLIFIVLLIVTFILGLGSRFMLGIAEFYTVIYVLLLLPAGIFFLALGFVYYFYPPVPTLKTLFRPLDIVLTALMFITLYFHILFFSDVNAHNEVVSFPFVDLIANTAEQRNRYGNRISMMLIILSGVFWAAIMVRGILLRKHIANT